MSDLTARMKARYNSEKKKKIEGQNPSSSVQGTRKSDDLVSRMKERYAQSHMVKSTDFDTLGDDLASLSTKIDSVYNGWQSRETMENTRLSVQNMYNRLGKYQEYQKAYGGTDLSQLHTAYKSVLDSWDDIASHYGQYKDADSYNKALEKTRKEAEAYEGMTKAALGGR